MRPSQRHSSTPCFVETLYGAHKQSLPINRFWRILPDMAPSTCKTNTFLCRSSVCRTETG